MFTTAGTGDVGHWGGQSGWEGLTILNSSPSVSSVASSDLCQHSCPAGTYAIGPWGCYRIRRLYGNRYEAVYVQREPHLAGMFQGAIAPCYPERSLGTQYVRCGIGREEECKRQLAEMFLKNLNTYEYAAEVVEVLIDNAERAVAVAKGVYKVITDPSTLRKVGTELAIKFINDAINDYLTGLLVGSAPDEARRRWYRWLVDGYLPRVFLPDLSITIIVNTAGARCGLNDILGIDAYRIRVIASESSVFVGECRWANMHEEYQGMVDAVAYYFRTHADRAITITSVCAVAGAVAASIVPGAGTAAGAVAGAKICGGIVVETALVNSLKRGVKDFGKALDIVPARIVFEVY